MFKTSLLIGSLNFLLYLFPLVYLFRYLNVVETVSIRRAINYLVRFRDDSLTCGYYSYESEHRCFEICLEAMTRFVNRLDVPAEERPAGRFSLKNIQLQNRLISGTVLIRRLLLIKSRLSRTQKELLRSNFLPLISRF